MVARTSLPFPGSGAQSNAAKSKLAKDASTKAVQSSQHVQGDDWKQHAAAADAHHDAAWKHQDAGNGTMADQHRAQAKVHQEKADMGRQTQYFAEDKSKVANDLSQKAEKAAFGQDPNDPRSASELHKDAAQAHEVARKAHDIAGNDTESKFHAFKAQDHEARGGAAAAQEGSSSSSASGGSASASSGSAGAPPQPPR